MILLVAVLWILVAACRDRGIAHIHINYGRERAEGTLMMKRTHVFLGVASIQVLVSHTYV